MIVINGFITDEIKKALVAGGTHKTARRHGNLIIAGGVHTGAEQTTSELGQATLGTMILG